MIRHAYDPLLCSRCHQAISHINEIHTTPKMLRCAPKKLSKGAFLYLFHDEFQNLLKIGFTESPSRRFKEIRNSNNNPIKFIGYFKGSKTNEAILHHKWRALNAKLEWFEYSEEIIDYFTGHPDFVKWDK